MWPSYVRTLDLHEELRVLVQVQRRARARGAQPERLPAPETAILGCYKSALRAYIKAPYENHSLWNTRRVPRRPTAPRAVPDRRVEIRAWTWTVESLSRAVLYSRSDSP